MSRVISWFSCGSASAVATKYAIKEYGDRVVPTYCDVGSEHDEPEGCGIMCQLASDDLQILS